MSFYNKDERGDLQRVTFDSDQVKRIFHGSFHKVKKLFICGGLMPKDSQTLETEATKLLRETDLIHRAGKMLRQQTKHTTGILKAENVSSVQHFPEPVWLFWVSAHLSWREWSRRSNVSLMVELLNFFFLVLGVTRAWHINRIAPLCSRWTSRGHTDTADAWDSKCVVYYSRSASHATTDVFLRRKEGSDKQMVLCRL